MNSRRRVAIAIFATLALACAVLVSRAHYSADLSAFLPSRPDAREHLLVQLLRAGPTSQWLLMGIEGATSPVRVSLSKELAHELAADLRFALVSNGPSAGSERDNQLVLAHRYLLSSQINSTRFSIDGLTSAMLEAKDQLTSALALGGADLLARDPTGETQQILDQLDEHSTMPTAQGVWMSPDGARALLMARTRAGGADTDGQQQPLDFVRGHFERLRAQQPHAATARLLVTGPGVFAAQARSTIESEVARLSILSTLLVGSVLLLAYRSVRLLLLGFIPVVFGALVGLTAVALGFPEVYGITLGFGITLIGEAVDYSIYLFVQTPTTNPADSAVGFASLWPTIRLGMLSSVCGFASLLPSDFPGLAQLGLYTVTGLIAAAAVTRYLLPTLLPENFQVRSLGLPILARTVLRLRRMRWWVLPGAACAIAILAMHHGQLWDRELSALSPVPALDLRRDAMLRADVRAADVSHVVVVTAASAEMALRGAELASAQLSQLVDHGDLAGFDSPSRYLPSTATQQSRRASLPAAGVLRTRTESAARLAGFEFASVQPFLEDVERARTGPLLTRSELAGSALGVAVDALLVPIAGQWLGLLPLRATAAGIDDARVTAALSPLLRPGMNFLFLNLKTESDALYHHYLRSALRLSLAGLLAIAVLLAVTLRSLLRAALILMPLTLAALVVVAGFALVHHPLNLLHLVGLLLIFAVGSNYALFFDRWGTVRASLQSERTLGSLLLANVTAVMAFGVLSTSSVPVLQALGSTVAPGAFLALVFAAMLSRNSTPHAD